MRTPLQPSGAEKQEQFREAARDVPDWCEACAAGRGRGAQHMKRKGDNVEVVIQFDYRFWSEDTTEHNDDKPRATSSTVIDSGVEAIWSTVAHHKGR